MSISYQHISSTGHEEHHNDVEKLQCWQIVEKKSEDHRDSMLLDQLTNNPLKLTLVFQRIT